MLYLLSEKALQKGLSEIACGSCRSDTDTERCDISDDEATEEEVDKVGNEMIDLGIET